MILLEEFRKKVHEDYKNLGIGDEEPYKNCVKRRDVWDDLSKMDASFITNVAIPFLKNWWCERPGKFKAEDLARALREIDPLLKPFRTLDIASANIFEPLEPSGKETYVLIEEVAEQLRSAKVRENGRALGFTTMSKLLHMCVPEFFVMCDESIREKYGCAANGGGYANFMIRMSLLARDLLRQAGKDKDRIFNYSGQRLTKLLDQYNYAITR
ncbi:MAG: hypothetical protein QXS54_02655 [Candidatus Methanomethylicaceae archaeon]